MTHSIDDYGLSALELEDKYQKYDYHPYYWRIAWGKSGSPLPYWQWVEQKLAEEQDELERDNPYN